MRRVLRACFGLRVWAMMLYGLLGFPLGLLGLGYLVVLLAASVISLAGGFRRAAAVRRRLLAAMTGLARLHRALARGLLDLPVVAPPPSPPGMTNPDTWRTVLYLLLKLPIHYGAFWFCWAFWAGGTALTTFPMWWGAVPDWLSRGDPPRQDPSLRLIGLGVDVGFWPASLLMTMAGLLVLFVAPSTSRIILIDRNLIRSLLGQTDAQRLRASRASAVDTSAAQLRRIERDLHDGAQAQLVALALKLGMAKEELVGGDIAAAHALVAAAHAGAKDTLAELRNLARGIHPPALDAGLGSALETLVARSPVPVDLRFTLDSRPSVAVETIAYFCVAELLTNVAKHSQARRVVVLVERLGADWLRLLVADDGVGGARQDGGGLTGLAERAGTVDGRMMVSSPLGGPTVVTVELPVSA